MEQRFWQTYQDEGLVMLGIDPDDEDYMSLPEVENFCSTVGAAFPIGIEETMTYVRERSTFGKLSECRRKEYHPLAQLSPQLKQQWLSAMKLDEKGEGRNEFFEVIGQRLNELLRDPNLVADLLVENLPAGTLERDWGLDPDSLHNLNSRLAVVRISNFGQRGPLRDRAVTPLTMQASYTWSKAEDRLNHWFSPEDSNDPELDRGRTGAYTPHNFVAAAIWNIPGEQLLTRGWRMSGVLHSQSGSPYTIRYAGDPTGTQLTQCSSRGCQSARPGERNTARAQLRPEQLAQAEQQLATMRGK